MKNHISRSFLTRALFLLAIPAVLGLAGQLVAAQTGAQYNLFKEVMAKKDTIVWKDAPENFDSCARLQPPPGLRWQSGQAHRSGAYDGRGTESRARLDSHQNAGRQA